MRTVFFENQENALEFQKRHVLPEKKEKVLSGAGINLEEYPLLPYPQNQTMHFFVSGEDHEGKKALTNCLRQFGG